MKTAPTIDGINRLSLAAELGIAPDRIPFDVRGGLSTEDKLAAPLGLRVYADFGQVRLRAGGDGVSHPPPVPFSKS